MHLINLDTEITNNKFWYQLFKIINWYYRIDWIKFNNRNYINCSNEWYDADETIRKMALVGCVPFHINHKCSGDDYCEKFKKYNRIEIPNVSDAKYIFSGCFDLNDFESWLDDYEGENEEDNENQDKQVKESKINRIIRELANLKLEPDQIQFVSGSDIIITNNCGINEDHRGSNHTILKLPFVSEVNLGKEFTFYDLLTANSNLKSHKFDNNYEMFCETTCTDKQEFIEIELIFDHGS
jgi:hypothetical protein